jgi:hypothetical protein
MDALQLLESEHDDLEAFRMRLYPLGTSALKLPKACSTN